VGVVEPLEAVHVGHDQREGPPLTSELGDAPGELVVRPVKPLPSDFTRDLAASLKALTGLNWDVSISDAESAPSLLQQEHAREAAAKERILATPLVRAAFEAFPEAELIDYEAAQHGTELRSTAS